MSFHSGTIESGLDFPSMLDGATDAIVAIDDTNCIIFFNTAAERMWKTHRSEVMGKNVKMLVDPEIRDSHDSLVDRHRKTKEARLVGTTRDLTLTAMDGSTLPVNLGLSEFQLTAERTGYLAVIKDNSDKAKSLREAIDALTGLGQSFDEVKGYGDVVTDLANRTNMLSLNAAIEASRAGEAGRSFSVVANEVKKLAENTSQTATRIKSTIEESISRFETVEKALQMKE